MARPASSPRRGEGARSPRPVALAAGLTIMGSILAGCGDDSGTPTLTWYINPDAGGQAAVAEKCSTDAYTIETQVLPQDASQQRIQLARRLAAGDDSIDLMSIDPPYTAEFANAGYLAPISAELATKLEVALDVAVGFTPRVVTRSAEQLTSVLAANPYPDADERKLLVGFMTERPSPAAVAALAEFEVAPEEYTIIGSEIYLHYVHGVGTSKRLAKLPLHKLGVEVTARNLRTVRKLLEMATES